MRLFADFITETKREDAEYASMMQPMQRIVDRIGAEPFVLEEIKEFPHYVADLKKSLRRYDRIIPLIKSFRGYLAEMLIQDRLGDMDQREIKYLKAQADFHKEWRVFDHQKIAHYAAMFPLVPAMERYVWQGKSPKQIIDDLEEIENKWRESRVGTVAPRESDKPIIRFDDGYAWVLLPRGGCSEEGDAMGHCGNGGGHNAERIYSLRETVVVEGEKRWKPCLTFIVHDVQGTMTLGEMKGRANTKPSPRYHDKIVALLASDYVDAIRGGGYKPENNFAIMDLPVEQRKALSHKIALWGEDAFRITDKTEQFTDEDRDYLAVPRKKMIYAMSHRDDQTVCDPEVGVFSGEIVVKNGKLISPYETHLILRDEVTSVARKSVLNPNGVIDDILKEAAEKKPYLWDNIHEVKDHASRIREYVTRRVCYHVPDYNPENRFTDVGGGLYLFMYNFHGKIASVTGFIGGDGQQKSHLNRELTRSEVELAERILNKQMDTFYLPDDMVEERLIADPEYIKYDNSIGHYGSAHMFNSMEEAYETDQGVWASNDNSAVLFRYYKKYNNGPLYINKSNVIIDLNGTTISMPVDISLEEFIPLYKGSETFRKRVESGGIEVGVKHIDDYEEYLGKKVKVTGR